MKSANLIIGVVAALALAGGGFAAGMTFERAQAPATPTAAGTTTGGRGGSGARGGSGPFVVGNLGGQQPVFGRVLAVNDGSITVAAVERGQGQNAQGASASPATTSQIVLVGASTRIVKTTETDVKLGDIKVNDQVTVIGTADTTGMVSATAIVVGSTNVLGQLFGSQTGNPGGFGGRPGASASPSKAP